MSLWILIGMAYVAYGVFLLVSRRNRERLAARISSSQKRSIRRIRWLYPISRRWRTDTEVWQDILTFTAFTAILLGLVIISVSI